MTVLYSNLCYNKVCYKGTALESPLFDIKEKTTFIDRYKIYFDNTIQQYNGLIFGCGISWSYSPNVFVFVCFMLFYFRF